MVSPTTTSDGQGRKVVDNWIFVTGTPRSGTTFVGKVLSIPREVDYIHEPFNPVCGIPGIDQKYLFLDPDKSYPRFDAIIDRLFRYQITLKTAIYPNDQLWLRAAKSLLGSRGAFHLRLAKLNVLRKAAVVKDPIGCLLTEYLAVRHGVKPIIMIRHPLAFVGSILRLNWPTTLQHIRSQPELVKRYFQHDNDVLGPQHDEPVAAAAALWRALNKVLLEQHAHHPEWQLVTHESLAQAPVETFARLYAAMGLPWSDAVARRIREMTDATNSSEAPLGQTQAFKRHSAGIFELRRSMLDSRQRLRVFEITKDVASNIYPESTFALE